MVGSETLNLGAISGNFADANAGTAKAVTLSNALLTDGTGLASDYTVANPAGLTADITQRSLNVSGITAQDKTYDGSTAATLDTSAVQLGNLVAGDVGQVGISATGTFSDANAAAGKTVNFSSLLTGSKAANYSFGGQTSTTAAITPKSISLGGLVAADKVYDGTTTASVTGGTLSGLVGSETLVFSAPTGSFANANAGTGKVVSLSAVNLADGTGLASNYSLSAPSSLSAAITPKALTLTGVTAADKVYDGNTTAVVSGGTLSGMVGSETLSYSVASANFNNKNVGTSKAVTLSGFSLVDGTGLASNYTVSSPVGLTAAITPKALTLTGASVSNKVYDGTAAATITGGSLSGMVAGETLTYNVTGATFSDKDVGTSKAVSLAGMGLVDGTGLASNYSLTAPTGLVGNITPKALTLTSLVAADKVYDGTTTASVSGGTLNGLVGSETLVFSAPTGSFADANAGTAKVVSLGSINLSNGTGQASNYRLTAPSSLNAAITPKALTLTGLAAADKVYDGNTTAVVSGGTLSGMVGSETLSYNVAGANFNTKNVGTSKAVTLSGLSLVNGTGLASNYSFSSPIGLSAAITPKSLTLNGASVSNKVYDGTNAATISGGTLAGMVAGETLTYNVTGATFSDKDAGTNKAVSLAGLGLVDGTGSASNYSLTTPTGLVGNITPKALTLTGLVAADKVYDGATNASVSGGSLTGLIGSETLGFNVNANFSDKNVGTSKTVTVGGANLVNGTGLASNYTVSASGMLNANITPKAISLTGMSVASKVYDGTTAANVSGGSLSGLIVGESLNFSVGSSSFSDANAGTNKAVTVGGVSLSNGTGVASNYTLSSPGNLTGTITPKALTLNGVSVATKVYDGSTVATVTGGTLSGMVAGQTLNFNVSGANFNNANAGTNKAVTLGGISLANGTGMASNYSLTSPAGLTGIITPKALTVDGVTVATKVYDGTTLATISGGTLNGLVTGETLNFNVTGANFNNANAGTNKAVTVGGITLTDGSGTASNYSVGTPTNLAGNITPKALTLTGLVAANKVYDGTTTATVSGGSLNGLVGSETLGFSVGSPAFADKNAGVNKPVAVTGIVLTNGTGIASNYTVAPSVALAATINPKELAVVSTTIADKTADGSTVGQIVEAGTLSGVVPGDTVALTGSSAVATFTQATPGTAIPVQVAGMTISGTDAPNYRLPVSVPTSGNIITRATVADGARYAAVLPELPKPFISSMGYVAIAESGASTGAASATGTASNAFASATDVGSPETSEFGGSSAKQPATQGSAEGRESKFLSVFVVGGGIQLPPAEETEDGSAKKKSPAAQ